MTAKIRRLGSMSLAEVADRSRQEAAKWVDRVARRPGGGLTNCPPASQETSAAFELFRSAAPRRFFPGIETGEAAEILRADLHTDCQRVLSAADTICARRFDVLGYENLSFGEPIDWHRDPVTARRAPEVHWSRIDPLDPSVGDAKVTWELNRHQWLIPLAQAYWLTRDSRYAQQTADLVDHWSHANPYGRGINWSSSLEVAYRVISWTWAFVLLRDAAVLSPREFAGLLTLIRAHAQHIERYLSRYFSPNTHLTGEALGLFYVGTVFPEFRDSARWRALGKQILVEECDRQIHRDGVHFEQATCYHRYTIEIYLHFLILAARNDVAVSPTIRNCVERMVEFLLAVTGPDGSMPQIGDADGGWLLPLARRAPDDCRSVLATAAVFFDRADFAAAARGPAPEVLWLLGASGWRRLLALQNPAPAKPQASRLFQHGGYAVLRSGAGHETHQLIFDVGPLGCPISGAHGHADLLSLQCMAFGEPYIVDPGTFCYATDMQWRNYFRGTTAHSTVVVDGFGQAQPSGPFNWKTRPATRLRSWESTEAFDYVDASHNGYTHLSDPVIHRRRVLFVKPSYWVVVDDLAGLALHDIALRFQFAARPVQRGPGLWMRAPGTRGDGLWMVPFASVPLECHVREGEMNPIEGWLSTHYGRRRPAPVVVYTTRARLPIRIATLLLPTARLQPLPPRVDMLCDEAGRLFGLLLADRGETIRFDDGGVFLERHSQDPNPVTALVD
jgi:hypothetical protein